MPVNTLSVHMHTGYRLNFDASNQIVLLHSLCCFLLPRKSKQQEPDSFGLFFLNANLQCYMTTTRFFPTASVSTEDKLFQSVADYFTMLSDPSRLQVLAVLCADTQELSVTEIVERCGLAQPNVSRHLSRLHAAGILGRRREKTAVFYTLKDSFVQELCHSVCKKFTATSDA